MEERYIIEKDGRRRKAEAFVCEHCRTPSLRRRNSKKRFCSRACRSLSDRCAVAVNCSRCGKEVKRPPSRVKSSKTEHFFCSRECHHEAQKMNSGISVQPAHYGTGLSGGRVLIQTHNLGDECQVCGEDAQYKLSVHHVDGNRKHNESNNLELVCMNCHTHRHLKMTNGEWRYSPRSLTPLHVVQSLDEQARKKVLGS